MVRNTSVATYLTWTLIPLLDPGLLKPNPSLRRPAPGQPAPRVQLVRLPRVSTNTFLALLALLLLRSQLLGQDPVIRARCVGVTDGDTLKVLTTDQQLLRIRLAWIDAPEKSQAFGQRAKQAMSELVFGKDVELRPHTTDRYGRLVCMVFVEGKDAGLELTSREACAGVTNTICRKRQPTCNNAIVPRRVRLGITIWVCGLTPIRSYRGSIAKRNERD
jgi:endonuclease YncB( thermonuclease family)